MSNTLDAVFGVKALTDALKRFGPPEIFNTDQGSQLTSEDFLQLLKDAGVQIDMDGEGRCIDNIFVDRLWRTVKYEYIDLLAFETGAARK
ncbi:MAG: transposase family protein [Magnetococcales bacterium]|nr:transposase family protein [Magnetococcales bacterium]